MNIADYYVVGLEEIGAWHDIHMRLEGPAVRKLQNIFLKMWNKETKQQVLSEQRTHVVNMTTERTPVVDKPESEVRNMSLEERISLVGKRTHEDVDIAIVEIIHVSSSAFSVALKFDDTGSAQSMTGIVHLNCTIL